MTTSRNHATTSDEYEDAAVVTEHKIPFKSTTDARPIAWWKYAAAAVLFAALSVPAISYTTTVMLDTRVATAVEKALVSQSSTTHAGLAAIKHSGDKPSEEPKYLELSNGTSIKVGNPYGGKRFEIHHCGSNAEEARAQGCAYDVMMQEWTPPACIDWELAERFLKAGNWTWWADSGAEKIYNATEVALGNHDVVYVDQSYHRHHCIFTWERFVRAMRTGRPLIEKLMSYDHVMHCRMNTLKTAAEGAQEVRGVVAPTAFVKCASLDVWLENLPENEHSSVDRLLKLI